MSSQIRSASDNQAVGVVIPVYNRPRLIVDALDSVNGQTRRPDKVVVVDDGSEDDTVASVHRWIADHPELAVELLPVVHGGVSRARNQGIQHLADFPFIAIPDSDDLWPADFLERSLAALQANPQAVAISSDRLYQGADTSRLSSLADLPGDPILWMIVHGGALISCSVFRTKALLDVGLFPVDLRSGEDSYAFMRMARLGPWLHLPGAPVIFRPGGGSTGEEGQLSKKYHDGRLTWAKNYEEFVGAFPAAEPSRHSRWQDAVARRWALTGSHYRRLGFLDTAGDCYRRAYELSPSLHSFFRMQAVNLARYLGMGKNSTG